MNIEQKKKRKDHVKMCASKFCSYVSASIGFYLKKYDEMLQVILLINSR